MPQAPFCTRADITTFGARAAAVDEAVVDVINQTIQARTDWICSYLGDRGQLPITAWDMSVRQACAIAVAWDLTAGPIGRHPEDVTENDPLYLRFKEIQRWLEKIAAGGTLPVVTFTPAPIPAGQAGAASAVTDRSRGWQSRSGFSGGAFSGERDER